MSLLLSAKVKRNSSQNEQLWKILDIGNVFGPTTGFKNAHDFQIIKFPKNYNPLYFSLATWENIAFPYTSPNLTQNLFNDWLWVPLL